MFAVFFFVFLLLGPVLAKELRWSKAVSPEVRYTYLKTFSQRGPINVHIVKVNPLSPRIKIRPAMAKRTIGMLEGVKPIAIRENAVAAINGSFFESRRRPHVPLGILISNGKIINKSLLNRTAMGILSSGDIIFGIPKVKGEVINPKTRERFQIWGVNRPRKTNEVILFTPEYGQTTKTNKWGKEVMVSGGRVQAFSEGSTKIPADGFVISMHGWTRKYIETLPMGSEVIINFGLSGIWEMADQVVTGGPLLIDNGEIVVRESVMREGFDGLLLSATSRTAVGVNARGDLMMFVVDKRPAMSVGATFTELAEIMKREGVVTGMALDGGGSSTMYVDGEIVNYPLYGYPVMVSNAIIVNREGYRYVAKKPRPKAAATAKAPLPILPYEVTYEALIGIPAEWAFVYEWDPEELLSIEHLEGTSEVAAPGNMLEDLYDKLVLPMIRTNEVY